ncbi:MAG: preprotein translocase subunit SecE [Solirubrobacterales bacterium]|nr:preprotein translocase subunit SecE [Solirubrobacterales bacterium]
MARDRKRAKQRRSRGGSSAAPGAPAGTRAAELPGDEIPAALEHAASNVDEFDAALVRGAGGVPAPLEDDVQAGGDDELQEPTGPGGPPARGGGGGAGDNGSEASRPSGAPLRGGNRAIGFLGASWAELQRVQWPDRRQVSQATAVVIGFVAIAGAYLGLADFVAKEIVEYIL